MSRIGEVARHGTGSINRALAACRSAMPAILLGAHDATPSNMPSVKVITAARVWMEDAASVSQGA